MPIAARLSRDVYDKLGDEAVNEFVAFLNAVDAASRDQIRELNETNWRRMDARFEALEAKVDAKLDALRVEMVRGIQDLRGETVGGLEGLRVEMHAFEAELIKWMFLFWIGTVFSLGSLMVVLQPR